MKLNLRSAALLSALLPFTIPCALPAASPSILQFSASFISHPGGQASQPASSSNSPNNLLAADRAGNLFVISNVCAASPCLSNEVSTIQVTRTNLSGNVLGEFSFGGSGFTVAYAAAIDEAGNLVIGGSTSSPDFPLLSPLQTTGGAFLTKIDPMLHGIVYSTKFGSSNPDLLVNVSVSAIAVDSDGNMYLAGTTMAGLPVTPGAFQTQGNPACGASAYVAEISASGSTLVFATYYSGTLPAYIQETIPPLSFPQTTSPTAILVDNAGDIIVAGSTSDNLPVTPGAYSTAAPTGALGSSVGFAAKFKPGGTGLVWGTYLPHVEVSSIAQDSTGNLVLAGLALVGFATTADAIQPSYPQTPSSVSAGAGINGSAGFVLKLAPTGDALTYATYFGGNNVVGLGGLISGVTGLAMDGSGDVWITGRSAPVALPLNSSPALGQNYIAELSPDLETLLALDTLPEGSAAGVIASAPGGMLAMIGGGDLLLITNSGSGPSVLGITSSPGFLTSPAIAPEELVTLYGIGIGPTAGQTAQIGSDGAIGTTLGGTQVLFNGTPSALLYAGPNQINAIVPEAVKGLGQVSVQVVAPTATTEVAGLVVQEYVPTLFATIGGVAAPAVNQDGTINGSSNPAPAGSIVAVWLTGLGSAIGSADEINISAPRSTGVPVSVFPLADTSVASEYGPSLPILYAGDAPDQANGISQINFSLPDNCGCGGAVSKIFAVQVGSFTSLPFLIYVQPGN